MIGKDADATAVASLAMNRTTGIIAAAVIAISSAAMPIFGKDASVESAVQNVITGRTEPAVVVASFAITSPLKTASIARIH